MSVLSKRRLGRDNGGATAIEYALIAGLLALGIVGSLVTTKGSLSGVFGKASSQMSGTEAAPASLGQTLWGSKTLSNTVVYPSGGTRNPDGSIQGGQVQYRFTYSDGSEAMYAIQRDANNVTTNTIIYLKNAAYDPNTALSYRSDANGVQTYFQMDTYAAGSNFGTLRGYSYQNAAGSTQFNGTCNGSCSGSGSSAPTAAFQAAAAAAAGQVDYFKALSAPLPIQ